MKQEAAERILDAIRCVVAGKVYLSESMTELMLQRAARHGGDDSLRSLAQLSDRELETLRLTG